MQHDIIEQQLVCWGPERNVTAKLLNSYSCLLTILQLLYSYALYSFRLLSGLKFRLPHAGTCNCHRLHICFKRKIVRDHHVEGSGGKSQPVGYFTGQVSLTLRV